MNTKLNVIAFVALGCVISVIAHPQLFAVEEPEHGEYAEPQEYVQEVDRYTEPSDLTRTRRDSGGHGWGWPQKKVEHKGWGWPSVGPVFTYVRTDGWSNFQWGVRHAIPKGKGKGWGKK